MKAELIVDAPIIDKKEIWVKKVCKSNFDHPFHFHEVCELTWLMKGQGKMIVGDHAGNFSEGDILFQAPGLPHMMRCDTPIREQAERDNSEALAIYFPSAFVTDILDDSNCITMYKDLLKKAERGMRLYGDTQKKVTGLIKGTINSKGFEQLGYFLQIIHKLCTTKEYELLASTGYKNVQNELEMNRFSDVYNHLFQNFRRDITLDEIARISNMSPSAFCRFFKLKTQKTFVYFLTEIRISHACRLLQDENYTIKDIIYECGFNNPVIFFRSFKSITGKTPREYHLYMLGVSKQ